MYNKTVLHSCGLKGEGERPYTPDDQGTQRIMIQSILPDPFHPIQLSDYFFSFAFPPFFFFFLYGPRQRRTMTPRHHDWTCDAKQTNNAHFNLGFDSKSGTLAARLVSCQYLCLSSSANDNQISDKTVQHQHTAV